MVKNSELTFVITGKFVTSIIIILWQRTKRGKRFFKIFLYSVLSTTFGLGRYNGTITFNMAKATSQLE